MSAHAATLPAGETALEIPRAISRLGDGCVFVNGESVNRYGTDERKFNFPAGGVIKFTKPFDTDVEVLVIMARKDGAPLVPPGWVALYTRALRAAKQQRGEM